MPVMAGAPRLRSCAGSVKFSVEETCTQSSRFQTRRPLTGATYLLHRYTI
jgi:hypothetical protein